MKDRLRATVVLSALFVVVYGSCNAISARRGDAGVLLFQWEQSIPIVPAMIVPYMSIDLFFLAAPFLCRTRRDLRVHVSRIVMATLVAAVFFLLMPLRLAETRPEMAGTFGVLHDELKAFDQPYNMFPSLHVAYLLLLWPVYAGRCRRRGLALVLHAWFVLILSSVLLVRQHYVVDMAGGAVLAVICMYVFPARVPEGGAVVPNRGGGALFALGAATLTGIGFLALPWSVIAAWPAASLLLLSAAHFGIGSRGATVFRKADGRVPIAARLVHGPYLVGLTMSRWWYWRRDEPRNEIVTGVWLGRVPRRHDEACAVVDLTAEHAVRRSPYVSVPVLDQTVPTEEALDAAVAAIDELRRDGDVLVCCGLGYSRSATAVVAWLVAGGHAASIDEAVAIVRHARPKVVLRRRHLAVVEHWLTSASPATP
jgi:protein-tyrosine phosphatase/uncharacterized membrane protein YozB (DUF420 family)